MISWLFEAVRAKRLKTNTARLAINSFLYRTCDPFRATAIDGAPSLSSADLLVPFSLLPLLLTATDSALHELFYSTGLYRLLPEHFSGHTDLFGLPFTALLLIGSWFDTDESRAKHYQTLEYTQKCIQQCNSNKCKLSLVFLALICECSPVQKWVQLLEEAGADFSASIPLSWNEETVKLLRFLESTKKQFEMYLTPLAHLFCENLQSLRPASLAALLGNLEYLQILPGIDYAASSDFVCDSFLFRSLQCFFWSNAPLCYNFRSSLTIRKFDVNFDQNGKTQVS